MKVVDLSHLLNPQISVFPGTLPPVFDEIDIEGYTELKITMFTHSATHIDAPCHILKNTKSLDKFPAEKFIGKGIVIDCKNLRNKSITVSFLKQHEALIKQTHFILFNSGWSAKWKSPDYFENFPTLTAEAALWLTQFNLKGIGLDSISLDEVDDLNLPNHKIVLEKEILIIENMTNLDSINGDFIFQCFPIKIENADGSPVRAVAVLQ